MSSNQNTPCAIIVMSRCSWCCHTHDVALPRQFCFLNMTWLGVAVILSFQSVLGSICSYMSVCISRVWTKCSQLLLARENVKKRMQIPIEPVLLEAQARAADRDNDGFESREVQDGAKQDLTQKCIPSGGTTSKGCRQRQ